MKQTIMSAGLHIQYWQVSGSYFPNASLLYCAENNPLHYTIRRWYSECHVSSISCIHLSPSWTMVRSSLYCSYVYTMVLFLLRADDLIPFVDLGEHGRFSVETWSRVGNYWYTFNPPGLPNFAWEGGMRAYKWYGFIILWIHAYKLNNSGHGLREGL